MIGWQLATYQATEGTPTVQACAEVLSGADNIDARTITLQVSTNPNTAQGIDMNFNLALFPGPHLAFCCTKSDEKLGGS